MNARSTVYSLLTRGALLLGSVVIVIWGMSATTSHSMESLESPSFQDIQKGSDPVEAVDDPLFITHVPPAPTEDISASLSQRLRALEDRVSASESLARKPLSDGLSRPSVRWTGQIQTDAIWASQPDTNRESVGDIEDGVDFRRARLGAIGDLYESIEYRIEFDFALANRPSFLDNWISVSELPFLGSVRVGHFFEPFSLERVTPNRFMTFLERSLPDTFAPARNTGAMVFNHTADRNFTWSVGAFRSGTDDNGDAVGDSGGWAGTARVTWTPGFDNTRRERLLHFGASYSFRDNDADTLRFRAQPELRMREDGVSSLPFFVDTGDIPANHWQLFGAELAVVRGPFSAQTEYIASIVDRSAGENVQFQAVYVYGSYFLTGEHRPYLRTSTRVNGVFDRVQTRSNVFAGSKAPVERGCGAWELACRWSLIDLNDRDIRGGQLQDITLGLNWYWNPFTRVQFNYIHPILDRSPVGHSTADLFGMRCGFDF